MEISIPSRLAHHALKAYLPACVTTTVLADIRGLNWETNVASWVLAAPAVLLLLLSVLHTYTAPCPRCKPRPLPRPLDRLITAISRYSGLPLAVAAILYFIAAPTLFRNDGGLGGKHIEWGQELPRHVLVIVMVTFLASVRYDRVAHPGTPRRTPITSWLRERGKGLMHKGHWLYGGSAVLVAATYFAPSKGLWGSLGTLCAVLLVASLYVNQEHGKSLCEQCVTEFRADAPEYAEKRRWRFTAVHQVGAPVGMLGGACLISVFLVHHQPWRGLIGGLYFVGAGAFTLLIRFHAAYQPWCPYCRRRGRGGGEEVPEGTPDPSQGRPVPA